VNRYRAAIVGLSWIAADPAGPASDPALGTAVPYSHASAYAATPNVEVVAGCDIAPGARESFVERWQTTWPELRVTDDYRRMLADVRPDILSVVTPDHLHAEVVIAAAEAGVRAIFCDKPLATSLADADAMLAAVRAHDVAMTVNFTRRWLPPYVAARQLVRDGGIGAVSQIVARFGGPRAMLFRNHSHSLDLLCYFAESDPDWVIAELEPGFADYGTEYRGDGGRDPAKEPGANAYVAFRNGVRAYFSGMKDAFPEVSVDVVGATGRLHVDDTAASHVFATESGTAVQTLQPKGTLAGMQAAVIDLITAVETGRPTQSPPDEARKTVAITMAILESQAQGNARVAVR
jgi:predicted dehydrogenase